MNTIISRILVVIIIFYTLNINAQLLFENTATDSGVDAVTGDVLMGSGVSFYDFDNDGFDDLSFATKDGTGLKFYKNFNGFFIEISLGTGLLNTDHLTRQLNWVDFDNDGDSDLFVTSTRFGTNSLDEEFYRNRLYENTGNLNFTEVTTQSGLPSTTLGTYGASWGDYNNDGFLDVFISNRDEGNRNYLFKNNGDGTFTDTSLEAGISQIHHLSFCSAWLDINNDGYQDLYISNDKIEEERFRNIMYKNNGDGTFTDISVSSGTNILIDAMTVTVADYDNDGWFDIYVTNLGRSVFLRNNGDETFTDVATETNTEFNSPAWCANFFDADNDGHQDLYVSGSLVGFSEYISGAFFLNDGNGLYNIPNNSGFGTFQASSFVNAYGDINNDGFPDLVETNADEEQIFLWENRTINDNNWIKINLEGVESNRDGIGSVIEISSNGQTQYRYTHCGESYLSQNSKSEFFGLGDASILDYIKVTWLSGNVNIFKDIEVNQTFNITEESSSLSNEDVNELKLSFYPNPTNEILNIESIKCLNNIEIYNSLGENISNFKADGCLTNRFDISALKQGIYFINLRFDEYTVTRKLIKI